MIANINKAKILDKNEEIELIYLWQKNSDQLALKKILNAYMRLVYSISKKYTWYGLNQEDLVNEGIIGLIYALKKFDLSKGYRLSTYSRWWIRAVMQDYILKNWSIVRTGSTASQKALFFNLNKLKKMINVSSFSYMGYENAVKISKMLKIKSSDVENMETRQSMGDQSLNQKINEDSENSIDLISLLKDNSPTQDTIFQEKNDNKIKNKWLHQAINLLKDREKIIILNRQLKEKAKTLEELGKSLNISKERVRQIETKALDKLQKNILTISNESKEFFVN